MLLYGLTMAALVLLMKLIDYRFLIKDIPVEVYAGRIAIICTGLGFWMGLRLTKTKIIKISSPRKSCRSA